LVVSEGHPLFIVAEIEVGGVDHAGKAKKNRNY